MFLNCCMLRKISLPLIPCDEDICDWFIYNNAYNNCFWILALVFDDTPRGLSVEEIAACEQITVEETQEILQQAIQKYRSNVRKFIKNH